MKILSLHFKNINSLAEEWTIRFDDSQILRSHLFAISGPTGAGKTSVLDALSLALYGQTPRQVAAGRSADPSLVMTLGSGESFAEVDFESNGRRYRAGWGVRRANKRADGNLQQAKRWILFDENGQFMSRDEQSKIKDIEKKIQEIVGLDFSQFTRAVMLPQGDFAGFLKSGPEEKGAILEKLSGQGIYREISKAVFYRNKEESAKLENIQQNLGASQNQLLPEADARDLEARISQSTQTLAQKQGDLKKAEEAERILNQVADAEKNCQVLRNEVSALFGENRNLDTVRRRLSRSEDAQKLKAPLDLLNSCRNSCQDKRSQKEALQKQIPEEERSSQGIQRELDAKKTEENALRRENANREALRDKVSQLDAQIQQFQDIFDEKLKKIGEQKKRIAENEKGVEDTANEIIECNKELSDSENYKTAHPTHKMLESEQAVIDDRLNQLKSAKKDVAKAKTDLAKAKTELSEKEKNRRAKQAEFVRAGDEREKSLSSDINRIAVMIQEHLTDGDPCPVCGNPFHAEHVENPSASGDITATASRLKNVQSRFEAAKKAADEAVQAEAVAGNLVEIGQKELSDRQKAEEECSRLVLEKLKTYGFVESDLATPQNVLNKIRTWAAKWKDCLEKIDACTQRLQALDARKKNFLSNAEMAKKDLEILENDLQTSKTGQQNLLDERQKLFGSKEVAEDRREWQGKVDALSNAVAGLSLKKSESDTRLAELNSRLNTISEQLVAEDRKRVQLDGEFLAKLRENGFASESDVLNALVPEGESVRLKEKVEKVSNDLSHKKGELQNAEEQLKSLHSQEIGHETLATIRSKLETLNGEIQNLNKQLPQMQARSTENTTLKKQVSQWMLEKEAQEKVVNVWSSLNNLIGSADGKKWVTYVQQLTLRQLIVAANEHLKNLDDRYEIQLDDADKSKLNFSIYDRECGERRSAANLSGGESFLVSLSLALGLSSLASQKVQIDTLFLDEGFGSLDEMKLQKAIDVLQNLGERGDKLVGVISHVERVKEGISNHIEIIPEGNGRSRIEGVGVTSMGD